MSSFIQTTQQATTDLQDINNKILSHRKVYTFFVFYQLSQKDTKNASILQKINFTLKEDKSKQSDNSQSNTDKSKQIQIQLYDIDNHTDVLHAISDVRNHSFQTKAKIIINASQEKLGFLLEQFTKMKVDLSSLPIMINSNQYRSDISTFLGWKNQKKQSMAYQSLPFYQFASQQWIKASTQKIDVWQVEVNVSRQKGQIWKTINNKLCPLGQNQKTLKQYFVSHFCIGYHASLLLSCKEKLKSNQESFGNNMISFVERFKKFCCVGQQNMKTATGIVNITLVDEKGQQLQILKQLRPADSSEDQSQTDFKSNKYKQYKDVLSILLTNINSYQNHPLEKSVGGKINDGKLQLLTFESQQTHRKICSSPGQIKIKLQVQSVDIQIGQSFYRLQYPQQIKINFAKKIKVGIHNQLVKC